MILALSRSGGMLIFHILAAIILLSICGFFAMTAALMVGLPVVEAWKALTQAVVNLPVKLRALLLAGMFALGLIDPVQLELRRIAREHRRALRDIHVLRLQAEGQMASLAVIRLARRNALSEEARNEALEERP